MAIVNKLTCGENGQMAVELAIVAPIILVVLVIVIDMLVFAGECAHFDHVAPQRVLAHAASAPMDDYDAGVRVDAIQAALEEDFAREKTVEKKTQRLV